MAKKSRKKGDKKITNNSGMGEDSIHRSVDTKNVVDKT